MVWALPWSGEGLGHYDLRWLRSHMRATSAILSVVLPQRPPSASPMLPTPTSLSLILCVPAGCAWKCLGLDHAACGPRTALENKIQALPFPNRAGPLGLPWCRYHQDGSGQLGKCPSLGTSNRGKENKKLRSFSAIRIPFMWMFLKTSLHLSVSLKLQVETP